MEVQLNGGSIADKVCSTVQSDLDLMMTTMELPFDCNENTQAVLSDQ